MTATAVLSAKPAPRPWYTILYVQVLIAIAIGILVGNFYPKLGVQLKPLGDGFIALIKMMIAPVIFCTIVHGIASMNDLKKVGRVGLKTLLYFEVVSSFALLIGLVVGEVLQPGAGFNIDPASLDTKAVATYVTRAKEDGIVAHFMGIIPDSFIGALARGDLLQVLLVSVLTGFAIAQMGKVGEQITHVIDSMAKIFFGVIRMIVRVAPIGAFGAMAFTVGAFGVGALWKLVELILVFYFFMIRPQAQKAKKAMSFQENMQKGEKIVTIAGIHGTVNKVNDDNTIELQVSPGSFIKIEKSAISMEWTEQLNKAAATAAK